MTYTPLAIMIFLMEVLVLYFNRPFSEIAIFHFYVSGIVLLAVFMWVDYRLEDLKNE